jgi:hypothetical protein
MERGYQSVQSGVSPEGESPAVMPGFCLAANRGTLPATARPASRAIIRRCRDIGVRKSKAGILFHGCSLIRQADSVRKIASVAFACGEVLARDFPRATELTPNRLGRACLDVNVAVVP